MGAGASVGNFPDENENCNNDIVTSNIVGETNDRIEVGVSSIYDPPKLLKSLTKEECEALLPKWKYKKEEPQPGVTLVQETQQLIEKEIGVVIPYYILVKIIKSLKSGENLFTYLKAYSNEQFEIRNNSVNAYFLRNFAKEHSIPDHMTIGEVVEKIIKPFTMETKESYVKSMLWRKHPQYYGSQYTSRYSYFKPSTSFVSLNWSLTFHDLLKAVSNYPEKHYAQKDLRDDPSANLEMDSYYYIDIFCYNFHEPIPLEAEMANRLSFIKEAPTMIIPINLDDQHTLGLCNQNLFDLLYYLQQMKTVNHSTEMFPIYFSCNKPDKVIGKLFESIGFVGDFPEGAKKGIIRRDVAEKSHQKILELLQRIRISFRLIDVEDGTENRRNAFPKSDILRELGSLNNEDISLDSLDRQLKRVLSDGLYYLCYRYYYPELNCAIVKLYQYEDKFLPKEFSTAVISLIERDWNVCIEQKILKNSFCLIMDRPFTAVILILIHVIGVIEDIVFSPDTDPLVFETGGPYGVSLQFLHDFIEEHNISDTMTTAEVVEKIIKPQTAETKETYVKAKLWKTHPEYFVDLRKEVREREFLKRYAERGEEYGTGWFGSGELSIVDKYYVGFLSHAWLMPFKKLVEIAYQAPGTHYGRWSQLAPSHALGPRVFYWIDVFCKNQHVPAPAMDEFFQAIEAPGRVVAAMWPSRPVALSRVWCLYELWTSLHRNIELVPTFPDDIFGELVVSTKIEFAKHTRFHNHLLHVEAQTAQATFPGDAEMILGMIAESVGIEEFNTMVNEAIMSFLNKKYDVLYFDTVPEVACFSGDGEVLLADKKSKKYVKDMKEGDKVITHEGIIAEIVLVTVDEIKGGELEMCEVEGVWLTPEHPVQVLRQKDKLGRDGRVWELPKNIAPVQKRAVDRVYNFELSTGGNSVIINGLTVITLGNDKKLSADELYGSGWKTNPQRKKYAMARGIQLSE